jgi:hypothetical protein
MRARWMRIIGLWTLLGLASGVQVYFAHRRPGTLPVSWPHALGAGLAFWYLWGLAAPAVAWLGRRFQVDRASFSRHFFIHLGASLDIAVLHVIALVLMERPPGGGFAPALVDDFTLLFHWDVLIYWAIVAVVHAYDYHRVAEQRAVERAELERALADAARDAGNARPPRPAARLLVSEGGRSFFVRAADVEWIEAARNYVRLHSGQQTYLLRATLGALEARLDRERFRRVGRSALVNVDRIREIQPWFHGDAIVILHSGAQVTLSRRYRGNLLGVTLTT